MENDNDSLSIQRAERVGETNEIDCLSIQPHIIFEYIFNNLLIIDMIKVSMCSKEIYKKCSSTLSGGLNHYWASLNSSVNKCKLTTDLNNLNIFEYFKMLEKITYYTNLYYIYRNAHHLQSIDDKRRTFKIYMYGISYELDIKNINYKLLSGENYKDVCKKLLQTKINNSDYILQYIKNKFDNVQDYDDLVTYIYNLLNY